MKAMEHINGKPLYIAFGTVCGWLKFQFLQVANVDISFFQKLLSAVVVAAFCGAASAGGGMLVKWMVKYFKEFKRKIKKS